MPKFLHKFTGLRGLAVSGACLLLLLLPLACSKAVSAPEPAPVAAAPVRQSVQRQAARASVWRFVHCFDDAAGAGEVVKLLREVAASQPFGKRIEVYDCRELSADTLGAGPIAFFGNRLPEAGPDFPLRVTADGHTFQDRHHLGPQDVLFLPLYRNPWAAPEHTVISLFYSASPLLLGKRLLAEYGDRWGRLFWRNWAYELHRANGDRIYGAYRDTTWAFDPAGEIALETPDRPVFADGKLQLFAYDGPIPPATARGVAGAMETVRATVDSLLGGAPDKYPEVRLYPSLERIGLRLGEMRPVQYAADEDVLHLVPAYLSDRELLGEPAIWRPFVRYHRAEPTDWRGPVLDLQARVATTDRFRPVFRQEHRLGAIIAGLNLPALEGEARSELLTAATERHVRFDRQKVPLDGREARAEPAEPANFLAGMTFAHEGYRIHNGYGGEKIKPSLDSLEDLHVNALAIVPYTFMRNPDRATQLMIPQNAGSENDWATTCSIRRAHAKGWFTLLKPQIWLGGGSWPGDVAFGTEEEWNTWFANYRYWILHYALLAEREGVGALCLGTELVQTTLRYPEKWRAIIADVRRVYGGQLTYAANWGEEFEGFTFWDDLDAIGLNSYYPLSEAETPTQEALNAGAGRWLQMAASVSRRTGKPLWLTEVGYRSVARAWQNPHAEAGNRVARPDHQAACFTALTTAARATPELRGMFVWKWPSYLGHEGDMAGNRRFTPGGKPAATVLGQFYADRTR